MIHLRQSSLTKGLVLFFAVLWGGLFAAPVPRQIADQAAGGWLMRHSAPMDVSISKAAHQAKAVADVDGRVLYYVIHLEPQGFVVVSADDEIEPVIAFSATGRFDSSEDSPLSVLLGRDMKGRLEWIGRPSASENQGAMRKARGNSEALCNTLSKKFSRAFYFRLAPSPTFRHTGLKTERMTDAYHGSTPRGS